MAGQFKKWTGAWDADPVKGYGQYCPIAKGAEIFAERWTPIIVRNLTVGCQTFGQILEGAPGIPRSLLSQRLRQLERLGVVEHRTGGGRGTYHLSESGRELAEVCYTLGVWGARWLETTPEQLDPFLALWYFARLVDRAALPAQRVVIRFDVADAAPARHYWVLLSGAETEVCVHPPGFPEDLIVTTDTEWLIKWHTGEVTLGQAQRSGHFDIQGPRELVRAIPRWGGLSPFAHIRRVQRNRGAPAPAPSG